MDEDLLTTSRVDHLPMVAQMIEDIGMVKFIDSLTGTHPNEIITTGQTVAAMVIMALGFVSRPTYLTPQFFESKAFKLLLGKNTTGNIITEILPEHLNDDKLGRALDEIYELGPDMLFQSIAFNAARIEKLKVPNLHLDTTSHSFYGAYEGDAALGVTGSHDSSEPCYATIEYGFSKDKRHDCKQLVQELLVSSDGDVPLMAKIHSGNESDVKVFQERVKELKAQFIGAEDLMPEFIVGDSKFYNESNIKACAKDSPKWITRVPDNILEAKIAIQESVKLNSWEELYLGEKKTKLRFREIIIVRYDIEQRFIVTVSDPGLHRSAKTIERQVKSELASLEKQIKKTSKHKFACELDAKKGIEDLFSKAKYHSVDEIKITEVLQHQKRGRPKTSELPNISYKVEATVKVLNEEDLRLLQWEKAIFIIGTNDLVTPSEEIINIYRKDQQGVERAFRFLKSPTYFAEAFFFKNTKRIVALLTIMTISLLIYSLLQRKLRRAIEEKNQPIPNQLGKPTKKPTMNWVNQCFEGIDLIFQVKNGQAHYVFVRMSNFVRQVLHLLGDDYVKRYSVEMLL